MKTNPTYFGLRKKKNNILWTLSLLVCLCVIAGPVQADEAKAADNNKKNSRQEGQGNTAINPDANLESLFTIYKPYVGDISSYKPMYFLFGTELEKSKFQISFKYNIFNPDSGLAEHQPWVTGMHFAYTQTSFWDLKSDSVPFEDTSYMPELFWLSKNFYHGQSALKGLFLKTAFQHESNGRGETYSRSTNFLYIQPIFILTYDNNRYAAKIAPKVWSYVDNEDENNHDLYRYRGYFDLNLKVGMVNSFMLDTSFRWASEGASVILDLSYPLHILFNNAVDIYLHVQYANALAENLLDYQERSQALRIGFSMVR